MGDITKGRNVRVEVALTYAAALTVTAVSQADPGVITSVGHGLSTGAYGYIDSVEGMVQLDGQAIRAGTVATDTFPMLDVNTTNMTAFSGSALFYPVATWGLVDKSTNYSIPEGAAEELDPTTLIDTQRRSDNGLLAAQRVTFGTFSETVPSSVMRAIEAAARAQTAMLFRITFLKDGAVRLFRGEPTLPGEDVQRGALGTGSFSVSSVKGQILKLPAV